MNEILSTLIASLLGGSGLVAAWLKLRDDKPDISASEAKGAEVRSALEADILSEVRKVNEEFRSEMLARVSAQDDEIEQLRHRTQFLEWIDSGWYAFVLQIQSHFNSGGEPPGPEIPHHLNPSNRRPPGGWKE